MKLKYALSLILMSALAFSCGNDDDGGPEAIPLPDRTEQSMEDDELIRTYLATHFYNYEDFEEPSEEFDNQIVFDTIAGENSDKTPLIDQVTSRTYERLFGGEPVDYTLYTLTARQGQGERAATFADSVLMEFKGNNLGGDLFESVVNPVWQDLASVIDGFTNGVAGQRGATGFTVQEDGTTEFNNDYGVGAVFMPSGLAYFENPPSNQIGLFASLVFTFEVYQVDETDHDGDGIISILEDVNNNMFLFDAEADNTDGDNSQNFRDPNDDNDGILTRLEIVLDEEGNFVSFLDTDGDGLSNHLDTDDDGDGIDTIDEIEFNNATQETTFPDSDGDGIPDYLDSDS